MGEFKFIGETTGPIIKSRVFSLDASEDVCWDSVRLESPEITRGKVRCISNCEMLNIINGEDCDSGREYLELERDFPQGYGGNRLVGCLSRPR